METMVCIPNISRSKRKVVKKFSVFCLLLNTCLFSNLSQGDIIQGQAQFNVSGSLLEIRAENNTKVHWSSFSNEADETIHILLPSSSDVFFIQVDEAKILGTISSNGSVVVSSKAAITVGSEGHIECPQIHLEASQVHFAGSIQAFEAAITGGHLLLTESSRIDASSENGGGKIFIGGGWQGKDPKLPNAHVTKVSAGSLLTASATSSGHGGTIVLWSEESTVFEGTLIAQGAGEQGNGGDVEVSSKGYLGYNGTIDISAQNGSSGRILMDPATITINTGSPNVCGNSPGVDMTSATQLDNATTTPTCAPTPSTANSIITAAALESFLTTSANVTLAASTSITVNAAVSSAANNVTLTLTAPTVDLNNNINLTGTGSVLQGSGVATVNVTSPGATFIFPGIIQDAVSIVETGGMVNLLSNTYAPQQVNITKNLTLNGLGNTYMGATGTTITCPSSAAPDDLNYSFTFKDDFGDTIIYMPVVLVQSPATDVIIQNLTVDGNNEGTPGSPNPTIAGIAFYDASGTIQNAYVKQVRAGPTGGGDLNTNAIFIATDIGNTTIAIQNSFVDTFQRRGIYITSIAKTVSPATINMNVFNNIVTATPTPSSGHAAPNGIECLCSNIGTSTITGTVANNTVANCSDTFSGYDAGGLIFVNLAQLQLTNNTTTNCDTGMAVEGCFMVNLNNYTFLCNKGSAVDFVLNAPGGLITVQDSSFSCDVYLDMPNTAAIFINDTNLVTYKFITNTFTEPVFAMDIEGVSGMGGPIVIMENNVFNPIIPGTTCVGTCP
jgi:hypothetical protein